MAQLLSQQFHAALTHLLAEEGRGAQSRLADQQQIDRGYMNAIVKGRKTGSEAVRLKIAAHFGMAYEEMLALGRRLLAGEKVGEEDSSSADFGDKSREFQVSLEGGAGEGIADKIRKAVVILESDNRYREVLAELIDSFYEAIGSERDKLTLRNQLREMESRVSGLERRLADEKGGRRHSA